MPTFCLSMFMYINKCMFAWIYLHASGGRCAKTEPSSYGLCETKNKWCNGCILTTKRVTQTNYYDNLISLISFDLWSLSFGFIFVDIFVEENANILLFFCFHLPFVNVSDKSLRREKKKAYLFHVFLTSNERRVKKSFFGLRIFSQSYKICFPFFFAAKVVSLLNIQTIQ